LGTVTIQTIRCRLPTTKKWANTSIGWLNGEPRGFHHIAAGHRRQAWQLPSARPPIQSKIGVEVFLRGAITFHFKYLEIKAQKDELRYYVESFIKNAYDRREAVRLFPTIIQF
jgi:hypothetical protein